MSLKSQYLSTHQRNICPGCRHWVLWYYDKKGKKVFGCAFGEIPNNNECRYFESRKEENEKNNLGLNPSSVTFTNYRL